MNVLKIIIDKLREMNDEELNIVLAFIKGMKG